MDLTELPPLPPGPEALFDEVADDYDQSGVRFFDPIARRLVELVEPGAGERALDLGCGRGVVTTLLAEAVAPGGSVTALDLSAAMVEHTRASVPTAEVVKGDAAHPDLGGATYDVVTASLVLFFLPEPVAVAGRWLDLLAPEGRLGVTTFGAQNDLWHHVDALFTPYLPPHLRDPRVVGPDSPFATDERFEALLRSAGATSVETHVEELVFRVDGPEQWLAFSLGTGQRAIWDSVPPEKRQGIYDEAAHLLDDARDVDGTIELGQQVRYSVARRD